MGLPVEVNYKAEKFCPCPEAFQLRGLDDKKVLAYLTFYDLPKNDVAYSSGYITVNQSQIFVQQFIPARTTGSRVFLSHGYCDHSALFKNVIKMLLDIGHEVVTWDYPGYGLSSGRRGYVKSFMEYTSVLEAVAYRFWGSDENFLIGHSAGCAYVMQPTQKWPEKFNKVLFLAPLVRCTSWSYVKAFSPMAQLFLRSTRRAWKVSSGDQEYFKFYRYSDPLVMGRVDVSWPKAMLQWEKSLKNLKPISQELTIFQGLQDDTVDWRYNTSWLQERFDGFKMYEYEKGLHHLQNECDEIKNKFLEDLKTEILA